MAAHGEEHIEPVIGCCDAGVHCIKVEQAHAKAGSKGHEGDTCQHVEEIDSWVQWHINLIVPNFPRAINVFFVKFL